LPHGYCDQAGLKVQQQIIDSFDSPTYLPLRRLLARDDRQVYFKTDPHWTTVGASVFARAVARELDPRIARRQRYVLGTETRVGLFNILRGIDTPETAETASPAGNQVKVVTAKSSVESWAGYPNTVFDHTWNASPAARTWPGHTLLIGDSFMLYALENMRPIFRHGRYMFAGHVAASDAIAAIKKSDTVVMEVLQTFASLGALLVDKSFRAEVRRALR
jgi:predicted heme/steroid binding protein